MPVRVLFYLLLTVLVLSPWSICHGDEPQPAPQADQPGESTDLQTVKGMITSKSMITYGVMTISADTFFGDIKDLQRLAAKGDVVAKLPVLGVTGSSLQITFNAASLVVDADTKDVQPDGSGKPASPLSGHIVTIQQAALSTCNNPQGHRHYELTAKTFTLYPDMHYEARNVAVRFAGYRIMTLPRLNGSFASSPPTLPRPSLVVGRNNLDGAYLGSNFEMGIGEKDTLSFSARIGSEKLPRGRLSFDHPLSFSPTTGGCLSLVATYREEVWNRLNDEEDLTINRLPGAEFFTDAIPIAGKGAKAFTLRAGAGIGNYHEDPSDVTALREQVWGIVRSPAYSIGPFNAHIGGGISAAHSEGLLHSVFLSQLSVETPEKSPVYANAALIFRRQQGQTPFLFDQVQIPDELFSEVEFPLGKNSRWRLNLANRQDLAMGRSREFIVMGIYGNDCFSYGVGYDVTTRSMKFGFIVNGLDTFHRGSGFLGFTQ